MVEKLKGLYVKHRLLGIIGIIWTVAVATLIGQSLYTTHKVDLVYDGIMYQVGNKEVEIPIVMNVQGKYYTTLNGKP